MFHQIRFKVIAPDLMDEGENIFGGIGEYAEIENEEILIRVICGCCGGTFEPNEIEVLDKYDTWIDLTETIVGD